MKILGIDLGTKSIGWAYIQDKSIKDLGVCRFPSGKPLIKDKEKSLTAERTKARGARRVRSRRWNRKKALIKILAKNAMCPDTINRPAETLANPSWTQLNPYLLRKQAIEKKLSLHEIGRALYHLSQRRGFLSNRKQATKEDTKFYTVIYETNKILKENETTLGSMLYDKSAKEGDRFSQDTERLRACYTHRDMYKKEFNQIWNTQEKYHTVLQNENLKDKIYDILFFQNPLKSQKHLVGNCTFEPKKTKCLKSHPLFEQYRAYTFVNNLKYETKSPNKKEVLTKEDRKELYSYLLTTKTPTFKGLIKKIKKKGEKGNPFNYLDNTTLPTAPTTYALQKIFKSEKWNTLPDEKPSQDEKLTPEEKNLNKEAIWHALNTYDDAEMLAKHAQEKFKLSEEKAKEFSKISLISGYANLSKKVIRATLPFLKKGCMEHKAIVFAGITNALGEKWNTMKENDQNKLIKDAGEAIDNTTEEAKEREHKFLETGKYTANPNKGGYLPKIKELLKEKHKLEEKDLSKLYHHSHKEQKEIVDYLPIEKSKTTNPDREILNLRNPLVAKALFTLRKLYNTFVEKHGRPDQIHIELLRDLKASVKQREEIRNNQKENEKKNKEVIAAIEKLKIDITRETITKYKLWEECNKTCPYTLKPIPKEELFGKHSKWDIEHIVPCSRSLNNSFSNLTLCKANFNRNKKKNKTPYELFDRHPEHLPSGRSWEGYLEEVKKLFKNNPGKFNRFKKEKKEEKEESLASSHLNDSRYISKKAVEYLSQVCNNIQTSKGKATSCLRYTWGLDKLLNPEHSTIKNRDDHRHHAVDALITACITPGLLSEITKKNQSNNAKDLIAPLPWPKLKEEAKEHLDNLLVYYHAKHKTLKTHTKNKEKKSLAPRGQLHEDTFYGLCKEPKTGEKFFHIRKDITDMSKAQVEKIVDPAIRKLINDLVNEKIKELAIKYPEREELLKEKELAIKYLEREELLKEKELEKLKKQVQEIKALQSYHKDGKLPKNIFTKTTYNLYDPTNKKAIEAIEILVKPKNKKEEPQKKNVSYIKTKTQVEKITDPAIRKQVENRIEELGGYQSKDKNQLPPNTLYQIEPTLLLPNKKGGDPVPVKKVRIKTTKDPVVNPIQLYSDTNKYIETGNNHCFALYKTAKREQNAISIPFFDIIKKINSEKEKLSLAQICQKIIGEKQALENKKPNDQIKEINYLLQHGDFFLFTDKEKEAIDLKNRKALSKELYRVVKFSGNICYFAHHTAALWKNKKGEKTGDVGRYKHDDKYPYSLVKKGVARTLKGYPIKVTILGELKFKDA